MDPKTCNIVNPHISTCLPLQTILCGMVIWHAKSFSEIKWVLFIFNLLIKTQLITLIFWSKITFHRKMICKAWPNWQESQKEKSTLNSRHHLLSFQQILSGYFGKNLTDLLIVLVPYNHIVCFCQVLFVFNFK